MFSFRNKAIWYITGASGAFSLMSALVKTLAHQIPSGELAFIRTLFTLLILTPLLIYRGIPLFGTERRLLFIRGAIGFISLSLGFYSLSRAPFADVAVLWKTSILFTALLSILFLQERVTRRLVACICLGLLGSAFVLKPSFAMFNLGGLAALSGGLALAIVAVSIRRLHEKEHSLTIIYSFSLWGSLLGLLFFFPSFIALPPNSLMSLLGIGVTGTIGQLLYTEAFRYAPASVVQPYSFFEVLFAMGFGFLFWGEVPDLLSLGGGCLIIVSGIGILHSKEMESIEIVEE